jgi:hypothetical protein
LDLQIKATVSWDEEVDVVMLKAPGVRVYVLVEVLAYVLTRWVLPWLFVVLEVWVCWCLSVNGREDSQTRHEPDE